MMDYFIKAFLVILLINLNNIVISQNAFVCVNSNGYNSTISHPSDPDYFINIEGCNSTFDNNTYLRTTISVNKILFRY